MSTFIETNVYMAVNGLCAWVVYHFAHTGRWDTALAAAIFCLLCESDRHGRKLDKIRDNE